MFFKPNSSRGFAPNQNYYLDDTVLVVYAEEEAAKKEIPAEFEEVSDRDGVFRINLPDPGIKSDVDKFKNIIAQLRFGAEILKDYEEQQMNGPRLKY